MNSIDLLAEDDVVVATQGKIELWHIQTQFFIVRDSHVRQSNDYIALLLLLQDLTLVTSKGYEIDVLKLALIVVG